MHEIITVSTEQLIGLTLIAHRIGVSGQPMPDTFEIPESDLKDDDKWRVRVRDLESLFANAYYGWTGHVDAMMEVCMQETNLCRE